jgi:hypothetical protein
LIEFFQIPDGQLYLKGCYVSPTKPEAIFLGCNGLNLPDDFRMAGAGKVTPPHPGPDLENLNRVAS